MKKWVFVTRRAGRYTTITPDGEETDHVGLDVYLGVGRGISAEEAFLSIYNKHDLQHNLPDLEPPIYSFEIKNDGPNIDLDKIKKLSSKPKVKQISGLVCEWCGEELSSSGAARFSHLKKHVNFLVRKKELTLEEAQGIRKVELTKEIRKVFESNFNKRKENHDEFGAS